MNRRHRSVAALALPLSLVAGCRDVAPETIAELVDVVVGRPVEHLPEQTVRLDPPASPPPHPVAGSPAGTVRPSTRITAVGAMHVTLTESDVAHEGLACGEHGTHRVLCNTAGTLPPGVYVVLWEEAEGLALAGDDSQHLQYGVVFDRQGRPNYEPTQFPGDFFFSSDLWVTVEKKPGQAPVVQVRDATGGAVSDLELAARFAVTPDRIMAVIPASAFEEAGPLRFRVTIHEHGGDFGRASEWSGATVPNVGEEMMVVTDPCNRTYVCGDLVVRLEWGAGPGECIMHVVDQGSSFSMRQGFLNFTDAGGTPAGTYTTRAGSLTSIAVDNTIRECTPQT